jgi:subtilisin family serine protease
LICRSKSADDWFQILQSVVHSAVGENRKDNQKCVRIAILDTGIDVTHPQIQAAQFRIKGYFSNSSDILPESVSKSPELIQDYHGHGTHGASVLLRTAPEAAIFVAKVTDKDGNLNYDQIIKVLSWLVEYYANGKAIDWAIQRKVHIISISWGIKDDIPTISTALNEALNAGILIFASASNSGANYPITFPARLHGIFCIGSSDGLGAPSTFNPLSKDEKYSVLGEAVSGACPKHLSDKRGYNSKEQTVRQDGTSTATPIAAAIAALFIDYSRQFMDGNAAWTYENIRKLFSNMSKSTVGQNYRYLAPWSLFAAGRNSRTYIKNIFEAPLGTKFVIEVC